MNLVIRHAEPDDFAACARIYAQPLAAAGTMQIPLQSAEVWRRRLGNKALMVAAIDLADNWLNLLRLELTVWSDNKVAQHLYASQGFVHEGTHRAYALRNGRYQDALAMARLHPNPPLLPPH